MTLLRSLLGALAAVMLWLPAAGAVDIKAVTTPLGLKARLVRRRIPRVNPASPTSWPRC